MTYTRTNALCIPILIAFLIFGGVALLAETGASPTYDYKDDRVTRYQELKGDAYGTVWEKAGDWLIGTVADVRRFIAPSANWMAFDLWMYGVAGWLLLSLAWTYALWPHHDQTLIRIVPVIGSWILFWIVAVNIGTAGNNTELLFWLCCDALIHLSNILGWSYIKTNVVTFLVALPGTIIAGAALGLYRHFEGAPRRSEQESLPHLP